MPDIGGNIGSSVQSHARTRGPFDGKLFIYQPISELPAHNQFYDLADGVYQGNTYGAWRLLRLVNDFTLTVNEGERQVRKESWKGKQVPLEGFYPERNPEVSFKLGELFDPYSLQLGLGLRQSPVVAPDMFKVSDEWCLTLQGQKLFPLPVEFNIESAIDNTVTGVAGTPVGTGGTLGAGTYHYTVTPVYGTTEAPYDAAAESGAVVTTGTTSQVIVNWTAASGSTPDYYRVYRTDGGAGAYTSPALVAQVPGYLVNVVDDGSPLDDGAPELIVAPLAVTDITGGTTYSSATDYLFNAAEGTLRRREGSTIGDGEMVRITYQASIESGVVSIFDQGRFKSLHLPLMLLGQQSGTRAATTLVRLILDSVDWTKGADSLSPGQAFDDAGLELSLPVDFNENFGRFGEVGVFDEAIQGFTVLPLS